MAWMIAVCGSMRSLGPLVLVHTNSFFAGGVDALGDVRQVGGVELIARGRVGAAVVAACS